MRAGFMFVLCLVQLHSVCSSGAGEIAVLKDLSYRPVKGSSEYEKDRCKLDLYLPKEQPVFATLLWFHGGALKAGNKDEEFNSRIAKNLAQAGVGIAMANYRLSPKASYPAYVQDAAKAFSWVRRNIAQHNGDPQKLFVGGHSAGGYLTFMIGLDARYLRAEGLETSTIAGLIPVSGQTMTHYTIREERGLAKDTIIADEAAPIHHVRKDAPRMLILYAENDLPARMEENLYLLSALKAAGHTRAQGRLITERDHGSIAGKISEPGDPAAEAILIFIRSIAQNGNQPVQNGNWN